MNTQEFLATLTTYIQMRFEKSYPEYFIRCKTRDLEEYDSSNRAGYKNFLKILNAINYGLDLQPYYKINDYFETKEVDVVKERLRVLNDVQNCEDIRIWCFNHISL